jgi:hypothetical protein
MSETFNTFVITKIICNRRTSGPAEPIDKIGPLFTITSSAHSKCLVIALSEQTFLPASSQAAGHGQDAIVLFDKSPGTAFSLLPAPQQRMGFVDWDMARSIATGLHTAYL